MIVPSSLPSQPAHAGLREARPERAEPRVLGDLLAAAARRRPHHPALIDASRTLDYDGFLKAATRLAEGLDREGLEAGDRVALQLPKSVDESVAIFGISLAGGVFVPVNPLLKADQVRHIVADCGVRFLVTHRDLWPEQRRTLGSCPTLAKILLMDGAQLEIQRPRGSSPALPSGLEVAPVQVLPPTLAAILYTSGSSGPPKGVMLSHDNLLAGSRAVCRYLELNADDRLLGVLPLSFDYGLNQLISAVELGATYVPLAFRFGNEVVRALSEQRITVLAGVPTIWALLTRCAPSLLRTPLPHLRRLTNSGGALSRQTAARLQELLPGCHIFAMYGLTEAFRSSYLPPSELERRPESIGRAIPESRLFVVDEAGRECDPDEVGVLVHDGPTVSLGYWGRPKESDEVLRPHTFFEPLRHSGPPRNVCYSGDLVRKDADGFLYFVGRADAQIKTCGYRVSPTEVERVLLSSGGLSEAAAVGLPDPAAGQVIVAIAVAEPQQTPDAADILAHCARRLPAYMVPRRIDWVDQLPLSPNGKPDYARLRRERLSESVESRRNSV